MGELSKSNLTNKIKKTIKLCVTDKKYNKILLKSIKTSRMKLEFWKNIITPKHKKILDVILNYLFQQDKMIKILSIFYDKDFSKKKKKASKEEYIMNIMSLAVKDVVKYIKEQHHKIERQQKK